MMVFWEKHGKGFWEMNYNGRKGTKYLPSAHIYLTYPRFKVSIFISERSKEHAHFHLNFTNNFFSLRIYNQIRHGPPFKIQLSASFRSKSKVNIQLRERYSSITFLPYSLFQLLSKVIL